MIRLRRPELSGELAQRLAERTTRLQQEQAEATAAREQWKGSRRLRGLLREHLCPMAAGINRCMYCADSVGTDIDHWEPLSRAPLRTFDRHNHFLACSHCNSDHKRERFPVDEGGAPLLLDPAREDPYEHLHLGLNTGEYEALSPKGTASIDVFGLNRSDLARGRAAAFVTMRTLLCRRRTCITAGETGEAAEITESLRLQPFADVLSAMLRYRRLPGAARVLGGTEMVEALADPALDFWGS